MKRAKKPVAVVSGGGHGIGRGVAAAFVRHGWLVVVAESDPISGRDAARALGRSAHFIMADVSSESSVAALITEVRRRFGRLDALINNAGVSEFKPLADTTADDWNRVIGINLTGAFLMSKQAAPLLRASRGAIVNVASTRALMSESQTAAYSASKGGLVALTHSLAIELGPDVRVNCVSPGWINVTGKAPSKKDNAQHPAGRVGRPEDVAELVRYLCSPAAAFMTGANVVIDGGMTRKMIYAE